MNTTKKLIIRTIILSILAFGSSLLPISASYAASDICSQPNVSQEIKNANGCGGGSTAELPNVIVSIINGVVGAIALVAVIFIIVGGINYMTSAGDASKIEKAKKTILYAAIGLIIAALAFAIVNFTINIINGSGGE